MKLIKSDSKDCKSYFYSLFIKKKKKHEKMHVCRKILCTTVSNIDEFFFLERQIIRILECFLAAENSALYKKKYKVSQ